MFYLISHENISAIHPHRLGFGGLCLPLGMMRGSVDSGKFQWIVANVDDVVPCSGWNADAVPCAEVLAEAQLIWAAAHPHGALTLFDADDVVGILHNLKPHVGAGRYTHDRHLHEAAGPDCISIVVVLQGSIADIYRADIVVTVISVLRAVIVIAIHRKIPFCVFYL